MSYVRLRITIKQKSTVDTQMIKRRESKNDLANMGTLVSVLSSTFTDEETEGVKMHRSVCL